MCRELCWDTRKTQPDRCFPDAYNYSRYTTSHKNSALSTLKRQGKGKRKGRWRPNVSCEIVWSPKILSVVDGIRNKRVKAFLKVAKVTKVELKIVDLCWEGGAGNVNR